MVRALRDRCGVGEVPGGDGSDYSRGRKDTHLSVRIAAIPLPLLASSWLVGPARGWASIDGTVGGGRGFVAGKGTTYVIRPRKKAAGPVVKSKPGGTRPTPGKPTSPSVRGPSVRRPVRVPKVPATRRARGRQVAAGALVVATVAGLWGWSANAARFERARDRAIDYFATHVQQLDPGWLGMFGYTHRRFGMVATLASGQAAHAASGDAGRPELFEIYRRIDDPLAFVAAHRIAALPTPIDRTTARALHCDRIPLPGDWIEVLRKGSLAGGYALTRSVLATEWSVENGCRSRQDVAALRADQIAWLVTFVSRRHELSEEFEAITDMWIEAVAMLHYIGAGDMVRREWVEELVRIQNDDGGWSRNPYQSRSDPHTTALALWVLLEHLEPDSPPTTWIRQLG